jgi:hypothetical protein
MERRSVQTLSLASGFSCLQDTSKEFSKFLIQLEKKGLYILHKLQNSCKKRTILAIKERQHRLIAQQRTFTYIYLTMEIEEQIIEILYFCGIFKL